MPYGNHLLGAGDLRISLAGAYEVYQSWSYETTGTAAADVEVGELPVVRTGTGVYTLTFPSGKRPASVKHVAFNFSLPGQFGTWAYVAATGVLTVTIWADANGDGTYAEINTDEEIIKTRILCVR